MQYSSKIWSESQFDFRSHWSINHSTVKRRLLTLLKQHHKRNFCRQSDSMVVFFMGFILYFSVDEASRTIKIRHKSPPIWINLWIIRLYFFAQGIDNNDIGENKGMKLTVTIVVIRSVEDVDFVERNLTRPRDDQISFGLMTNSHTSLDYQDDISYETERGLGKRAWARKYRVTVSWGKIRKRVIFGRKKQCIFVYCFNERIFDRVLRNSNAWLSHVNFHA